MTATSRELYLEFNGESKKSASGFNLSFLLTIKGRWGEAREEGISSSCNYDALEPKFYEMVLEPWILTNCKKKLRYQVDLRHSQRVPLTRLCQRLCTPILPQKIPITPAAANCKLLLTYTGNGSTTPSTASPEECLHLQLSSLSIL